MVQPHLAHAPFQIGDVNLMDAGLFRQVDLSPAVLLTEIADSLADLDADIRGHPPSIDLVDALFLLVYASDHAKRIGLDRSEHLCKVLHRHDQGGLSRQ